MFYLEWHLQHKSSHEDMKELGVSLAFLVFYGRKSR